MCQLKINELRQEESWNPVSSFSTLLYRQEGTPAPCLSCFPSASNDPGMSARLSDVASMAPPTHTHTHLDRRVCSPASQLSASALTSASVKSAEGRAVFLKGTAAIEFSVFPHVLFIDGAEEKSLLPICRSKHLL